MRVSQEESSRRLSGDKRMIFRIPGLLNTRENETQIRGKFFVDSWYPGSYSGIRPTEICGRQPLIFPNPFFQVKPKKDGLGPFR